MYLALLRLDTVDSGFYHSKHSTILSILFKLLAANNLAENHALARSAKDKALPVFARPAAEKKLPCCLQPRGGNASYETATPRMNRPSESRLRTAAAPPSEPCGLLLSGQDSLSLAAHGRSEAAA